MLSNSISDFSRTPQLSQWDVASNSNALQTRPERANLTGITIPTGSFHSSYLRDLVSQPTHSQSDFAPAHPQAPVRALTRQATLPAFDDTSSPQNNYPHTIGRPLTLQPTLLVGDDGRVLENQHQLSAVRGLSRELAKEGSISSTCAGPSIETLRPSRDILESLSPSPFGAPGPLSQLGSMIFDRSTSFSSAVSKAALFLSSTEFLISHPPSIHRNSHPDMTGPCHIVFFAKELHDVNILGVPLLDCIEHCTSDTYMVDCNAEIPMSWLEHSLVSDMPFEIKIELTWPGYPNMSWFKDLIIVSPKGQEVANITKKHLAAQIAFCYQELISCIRLQEDIFSSGGDPDPDFVAEDAKLSLGRGGLGMEKMNLVFLKWSYGNVFHAQISVTA